ncbi:4Fe-4S single cluster domain-containing protein [Amycolatopsis sp. DG1A-15b]|uniref:4Fe-4S single cluster domain-containing protein n=1 Tax=Amycolatopsis sp. DG1A-15b TaxID=3052846 RepID=UPI00255BF5C0|nr:4Fe-4S single cluster domain-containing protein [Amycolatopsis sp. DG1A-15b]WIX92519.1 4Fe-4S single cluster domain-containing protein [Amycolatopsis sp. DG1A-15b]
MKVRIARLHHPVTALGPGRRIGIWTQGCAIACPGCASRDTWVADDRHVVDVSTVLEWCAGPDPSTVDGVTISGGEPSEQPEALTELVTGLDEFRRRYGWDVLCFTGVEYEDFVARCPRVPALIDALVTGPYRAGEPTDLVWRGSANQRLVPIGERGRERYGRWVDARPERPPLQVQVDEGRVWLVGVPRSGDLGRLQRRLRERGIELEDVSWRP